MSHIQFGLHRMSGTEEDVSAVQNVLDAIPNYSLAISGAITPADAGSSVFTNFPPGCREDQKWVLGITYDQTLVGVVDLIRGYPVPSSAYVGLVAVSEAVQRRGIGRAAVAGVEQIVKSWQCCDRVRLAIVATNITAVPFWTALGFQPTGQKTSYSSGSVISESVIYEKLL